MFKILYDCINSKNLTFNLRNINNQKIEVKASKVFRKQQLKLDEKIFYELIINNSNRDRLLCQNEIKNNKFDCNIQQIKVKLFDMMIYLLFFKDVIEIFEINSNEIQKDKKIFYSNK